MNGLPTAATVPWKPGTGSANEAEWSLLLAACSENIQPQDPDSIRALCRSVRWKVLFDLADRHGVHPLLCQTLSKFEAAIPPAEMRVLGQLYQANLHKCLFLARELIRIVDHLSENDIEVLTYKGVALAEALYGDIALRQAGDIDLLIHAKDLFRVRKAAAQLGYVPHEDFSPAQERAYIKTGYEYAFDGAAGRNLLEVQWAVQPRFYAVDFDQEAMFQRAISSTIAGHVMKMPSTEDLFIVLALHAAKHVWGRLIWLCDLARISRLPTLDWNRIGDLARQSGIARILRVTLLLSNQLLTAEIPASAESAIRPDPEAAVIANEIQKCIGSARAYDVESFSYFGLMLRLRENRSDQIRFLTRLVFTPGPGEWSAVRLPQPLFPLYRMIRLYRLTRRLVRA